MRIPCPHCGERDVSEFHYGGDATLTRPDHDNTDRQTWYRYIFIRDNPRGRHREFWHHRGGCREWVVVERNTLTHEIFASWRAKDGRPEEGKV